MSFLLLLSTLFGAHAHARCGDRVSPERLAAIADAGMDAYASVSMPDFRDALADAREALPCLDAVAPAGTVAAVYRLEALSAFLLGDDASTVDWFAVVHALDPAWELPLNVAPARHPLRERWLEALARPEFPRDPLPVREDRLVHVDGVDSSFRPIGRSYLVQVTDADGALRCSEVVPAEALNRVPCRLAEDPRARAGRALILTSGGLGAATAGMVALSVAGRMTFNEFALDLAEGRSVPMSEAELDALVDRTNGLSQAASVAGTVALGLGVCGAALVIQW